MVKRGAPKQTGVRQSARYPEDVAAGVRMGWLGALGVGRVATWGRHGEIVRHDERGP